METFDLHISDELTRLDGGLRLGAALRWSLHMSSDQNDIAAEAAQRWVLLDIEEYADAALKRALVHHQNVRLLVESGRILTLSELEKLAEEHHEVENLVTPLWVLKKDAKGVLKAVNEAMALMKGLWNSPFQGEFTSPVLLFGAKHRMGWWTVAPGATPPPAAPGIFEEEAEDTE
jgi:hypothetical protein